MIRSERTWRDWYSWMSSVFVKCSRWTDYVGWSMHLPRILTLWWYNGRNRLNAMHNSTVHGTWISIVTNTFPVCRYLSRDVFLHWCVLVRYVRKFFDVSPLRNEADFSTSAYFVNIIIVFEFAILIYMYIEVIDFSLMSITALKRAIFLNIFSLTKLYYHVEVDDDIWICARYTR